MVGMVTIRACPMTDRQVCPSSELRLDVSCPSGIGSPANCNAAHVSNETSRESMRALPLMPQHIVALGAHLLQKLLLGEGEGVLEVFLFFDVENICSGDGSVMNIYELQIWERS